MRALRFTQDIRLKSFKNLKVSSFPEIRRKLRNHLALERFAGFGLWIAQMTATAPNNDHDSLPTRWSLLTRLKDWEDQASWQEFFDTYCA
jgi:hypothetical protein